MNKIIKSFRSKAARHRVWRFLNTFVAIVTIVNVSMVGTFVMPKAARAVAVWTTHNPCVDDAPQDENEYANGDTIYVRGSGFDANTTEYWRINGQPGGASADPGQVVASGTTSTDGTGYFCVGAYVVGSDGDLDDGVYNVDVAENANFTGSKQDNYHVTGSVLGSITVEKQTIPDGSTQQFTFNGELSGAIGDGQTLSTTVQPGIYAVTELVPAGWTLDSVVCNDSDSELSGGTTTAFEVDANEDVTCVYTNSRDTGTVHVFKQVRTSFGFWWEPQADALWSWNLAGDATDYHWGDSTQVVTNVVQTITEDPNDFPAPGYTTEWSCYEGESFFSSGTGRSIDFTLTQDGQEIVCTFYNKELGDIHGQKWSDLNGNGNWDGGEPALNGWTVFIDANGNGALDGDEQSTVTQFHDDGQAFTTDDNGWYWFENLPDGDYKVCEVNQGGWQQTYPLNGNNNCHTMVVGQSLIDRQDPSTCSSQAVPNGVVAPACNFGNKMIPVTTINLVKDGPATVTAGDNITYTLNWSVAGNTAATNAVITDPIPANTTFVSADNGGTLTAGVVTWNLGTKNPGDNGTVSLTVKSATPVTDGTLVTNTGTFDTDQTDPKLDDANTTLRFTPPPTPQVLGAETHPNLEITKTVNDDTAKPGDILTYTITVTSTGDADATNVVVTDTLPDDFSFAEGSGKTRTWDLGTLAPGQSSVINVDVRVESDAVKGDYINVATVEADEVDQKQASATVTVSTPQVLGLATTGSTPLDYALFMLGALLAAFGLVGLTVRRMTPVTVRK